MNNSYRSVWNESLGAWVATSELTSGRGKVRATVVAAVTLLGLANVAWGAQAVNDGTLCMSQSGPGQTWTCHVPNGQGGFAIIKGLPDVGNGSSPDWPAVAAAAAANLGTGALLLGDTTTVATGTGSIAIGNGAKASTTNSVAIGTGAQALDLHGTFIGASAGASSTGQDNTGVGHSAGSNMSGLGNSALGSYALLYATGDRNSGMGGHAGQAISGSNNTALGYYAGANVIGDGNVAIGFETGGGPYNNGLNNVDNTVAIGFRARTYADDAIAIGNGARATGISSISIGKGNVVRGARSGAIGDPSFIDADDSYAIGNNNTIAASAKQSFVLGNNVTVTNANNVVLGNNSADKAAIQVNSAAVPGVIATLNPDGTVTYSAGPAITYGNFAGIATGVVSVGAAGAERQIVNVAPGAITARSTDAVNGSQLYSIASSVNALSGSITNIVNNAQTHYYSVNDGGTTQGNYANDGASGINALAAGAGASASGAGAVAMGNTATASAANSVAVGSNATASTANSVALGNGSTTTAATPTASTTIQGQTYNFAGANPVGVVSVGAPGAERQIQNVAAGQLSATSTDAVNGSQLYATNQAVNNIQAGGGIKYFHANSQAADSQAAGAESVAIGPQAVSQGAGSIAVGNSSVATAANGVALGAGATADRAGMAGGQELFSNAVVGSTQGAVSVGSAGNERQITNVAGGTQATDAVNVRQLQAVKASSVQYDTNVDGTTNYNNVTLGNNTGPTTIHNVAPGVAGNDAVNVNQLTQASAAATTYTDSRVNQLRGDIKATAKDASAGAAGAMAMASMPQAYIPGKSMLSAGVGSYGGQGAVAVGMSKLSDNGRWVVKFAGSADSRGKVGVSAGAGFHW